MTDEAQRSVEELVASAMAGQSEDWADLRRIANASRDFGCAAAAAQQLFPEWRAGQAHMNVLRILRPDLYLEATGTSRDPFYDDSRIGELLTWVDDRLPR